MNDLGPLLALMREVTGPEVSDGKLMAIVAIVCGYEEIRIKPGRRFDVLKRDGFRCRYCGRTGDAVPLEVDHVVPRSRGGSNAMDNLVTACVDCNQGKSGK